MVRLWGVWIWVWLLLCGGRNFVEASVSAPDRMQIRVRLEEGLRSGSVRGFDLRIYDGQGKLALSSDRVSTWAFRCKPGKVILGNLELDSPVSIATPAGFFRFQGRPYRERLMIWSKADRCEAVNEVNLEKYLDGLVNSEFSAKWDPEAIGAQVIAARTYAYFQILAARREKRHFDLDATVKDQVYDGSIGEDFRSSRAVEKTWGLILSVRSAGVWEPVKAFYHSMCGGRTDLPQNVWRVRFPGLGQRVGCPYCQSSPTFRWSLELTTRQLTEALSAGALKNRTPRSWPENWKGILENARLVRIDLGYFESGPRVKEVVFVFRGVSSEASLVVPAPQFRGWVGLSKLRSTIFSISHREQGTQKAQEPWIFLGSGNGHGVGMCQWGAKVMGEKGFKTAQILKFYYPGAVLRKEW